MHSYLLWFPFIVEVLVVIATFVPITCDERVRGVEVAAQQRELFGFHEIPFRN